ncbi:MAG: type III pantothenate kinase [Opitutales bacterium]|jgi:type III pantothenate kinase|nr:type III pantothenate kinase [Opitutales bacterium]
MLLCLDIGNTTVHGGAFDGDELIVHFRKTSEIKNSSDEIGLFLRSVLRENGIEPEKVSGIALCSVVPSLLHSIRNACYKYFELEPFILQAGAKTGLKIKYRNPLEVGADRIATAIAATHLNPDKNVIVVDFGTATTFCAINAKKEYLGGAILPGIAVSMETLEERTAKLPLVEIIEPEAAIGRSTVESIQAGLFYSQVGTVRELAEQFAKGFSSGESPVLLGTGGYARLFQSENLFDHIYPNLVLNGLYLAYYMNQ